MARVWVKGFTKSDGTKVKGHYRVVDEAGAEAQAKNTANYMNRQGLFFGKLSKKDKARVENKIRLSELSSRIGGNVETKSRKAVASGAAWNTGLMAGRKIVRSKKAK